MRTGKTRYGLKFFAFPPSTRMGDGCRLPSRSPWFIRLTRRSRQSLRSFVTKPVAGRRNAPCGNESLSWRQRRLKLNEATGFSEETI